MPTLRIGLYIGSWPQNIGNAFFDLGARALMQRAFPEAVFFNMGGAVHWMFEASRKRHAQAQGRLAGLLAPKTAPLGDASNLNSLEIAEYAEVDLLVFAGMSMCEEFVVNNGRTFLKAAERGIPVLGLGTGAAKYTQEEARVYARFLKSCKKVAIITRDDDTYGMFKDKVDHISSGIDCAFALPLYYTPPRLALPVYDVVNFDGVAIPTGIDHGDRLVLYAHHDCWGILPKEYIEKPRTLVSDVPEDYLTLYSQARETHANRVHACVATLAYGNKARLYSTTPRRALFAKVGAEGLLSRPTSLDLRRLHDLIEQQIENIKDAVRMIMQ